MNKIIYYFLITLSISIIGCKKMDSQELNKATSTDYTYLALGDSYTIGESVEVNERFPVQLQNMLIDSSININRLDIVAKTGWTTDELMTGIATSSLLESYNLVTLLIGVNNQYRGRDTANYRLEFKQVLNSAIQFAGNIPQNVIVVSIPDWGVTPFAENRDTEKIAEEIDAFNAINCDEAMKAGTYYINITDISRQVENNPELIANDGLHPSGAMYASWVERLFPKAKEILLQK